VIKQSGVGAIEINHADKCRNQPAMPDGYPSEVSRGSKISQASEIALPLWQGIKNEAPHLSCLQ